MKTRSGFTLIELLVVIAIIAILAAILFPVFAQAREKARAALCLSNTKQLSLAVNMYAQDYDEKIPILGVIAENRGRWMWQIKPYTKNNDIFTDPNTSDNRYDGTQFTDRTGYGWNFVLRAASGYATTDADGFALSQFSKSAETIIIGDTGYDGAAGWAMYANNPAKAPATDARPGYWPQFRHNVGKSKSIIDSGAGNKVRQLPIEGIANFVFLDGHAKGLPVGTAFREADTEDGNALANASDSELLQPPNTRYVMWNIY